MFETDVVRLGRDAAPGATATLYDERNKLIGIGLFDPDSPIRVRVLGAPGIRPDIGLFQARVADAVGRRGALHADPTTDGYRLVHGPNDGLPGLVVDRFASTAVIKVYTGAWAPHLRALVDAIAAIDDVDSVVLRTSRNARDRLAESGWLDGTTVAGPAVRPPVVFAESGLRFEADPLRGHKTGFFLDQRENRRRVEALSADARVLNVFSYNGGFSLYSARGGATEVVSVDISAPAIAAAERNFALNPNLASVRHRAVVGDAFEVLAEGALRPPFDVVIIDPPAFAKRASERERALEAYARLTRLGLGVLRPGGALVLASCSSRVSAEEFEAGAERAAKSVGRPLAVFERTGQPLDHPATFPEAAYLKCLYARA